MTKQRGATPYCREHTLFSPSHGGKFPLGKIAENFPHEIQGGVWGMGLKNTIFDWKIAWGSGGGV